MEDIDEEFPMPSSIVSGYGSKPAAITEEDNRPPPPPSPFASVSLSDDAEPFLPIGVTPPLYHDHHHDDDDDADVNALSEVVEDDDGSDNNDIESLSAKARALASAPVPFSRLDQKERRESKKKYTAKRYLRRALDRARRDGDDSRSAVLANRTSNILNEFETYVADIEVKAQRDPDGGILRYELRGGGEAIRGAATNESEAEQAGRGLIAREWSRDEGSWDGRFGSLHGGGGSHIVRGGDDDDDGDGGGNCKRRYAFAPLYSKRLKIFILSTIVLCFVVAIMFFVSSREDAANGGEALLPAQEEAIGQREPGAPVSNNGGEPNKEGGPPLDAKHPAKTANQQTYADGGGASSIETAVHSTSRPQIGTKPERNEEPGLATSAFDEGSESNEGDRVEPPEGMGSPAEDGGSSSVGSTAPSTPAEGAEQIGTPKDEISVGAPPSNGFDPVAYGRNGGWTGRTYLEAVHFCSRESGREICPIAAICPAGVAEGAPMWWVPVSDGPDRWVGLDQGGACVANDPSEWLRRGPPTEDDGNSDAAGTILCCDGNAPGAGAESFLYMNAAKTYRPLWYGRGDGWAGRTYDEALEFCRSTPRDRGRRRELCPYEAYCPMADLGVPLGRAVQGDPSGSWAPVGDTSNGWVSVGSENVCQFYSAVNGEAPEWGVTGEGNEEITRHVMCCEASG